MYLKFLATTPIIAMAFFILVRICSLKFSLESKKILKQGLIPSPLFVSKRTLGCNPSGPADLFLLNSFNFASSVVMSVFISCIPPSGMFGQNISTLSQTVSWRIPQSTQLKTISRKHLKTFENVPILISRWAHFISILVVLFTCPINCLSYLS